MAVEPQASVSITAPPELLGALHSLDPSASLAARLDAVENIARWVIEIPTAKRLSRTAPQQIGRLRILISTLAADPTLRGRFSVTLGSILRETTAVPLFSEAGLPSDRGLASETV